MSDEVLGFNRTDANLLLGLVNGAGSRAIAEEMPRHRVGIQFGKTKTGGLAANSTGQVYWREPTSTGWTDTTVEYDVYNEGGAIAGSKIVLLVPVNGRFLALEVC